MADLKLTSPLSDFTHHWDGLHLHEVTQCELVSLSVAMGQEKAFAARFKKQYGKTTPKPNQIIAVKGGHAFWSAPDQYMLMLDGEGTHADEAIAEAFSGLGYSTLQTDNWAHLALSGEKIMDVFERFLPLDMARFEVGQATRTQAHHIALMVARLSETDYRLLTPSSSARSFLESLKSVIETVT